jgi:hypothetical protein
VTENELLDELAGPARPLSLLESAYVLGGLRWVELEGYSLLGIRSVAEANAPGAGEMQFALWAAASSFAHAWRAEQLLSLLPVSGGLPAAEVCTRSPGPRTEEAIGAFAGEMSGPERRAARYAALASWYAALVVAYERRSTFIQLSTDGPLVTTLLRVLADLRSVTAALGLISTSTVRKA